MSKSALQTYQAPKITPHGDDWTNPQFLNKIINKKAQVQIQSHYDWENHNYVNALLESNLNPETIGSELNERAQRHKTYFNGDTHFQDIRKSVIGIYNSLASLLNRRKFEAYLQNTKPEYVNQILNSNLNQNKIREKLKTECKNSETFHQTSPQLINTYNQLSELLGRKNKIEDKLLPVLSELPPDKYWVEWNICDYNHKEVIDFSKNEIWLYLSVKNNPDHVCHYPVVRNQEIMEKLEKHGKKPLGWKLEKVGGGVGPTIWSLVYDNEQHPERKPHKTRIKPQRLRKSWRETERRIKEKAENNPWYKRIRKKLSEK